MNQNAPGSDPVYKRLYAFREMVADLLRSVLPADALGAVDLRLLEKVPASHVGDDFRQRHGDAVWRLRAAGAAGADSADSGWAYALVLLEFQSGSDEIMALRITQYTTMLYHELLRGGSVKAGRLPPVLPVVLYNGDAKWSAARDMGELITPTKPALAAYQPSQRYAVVDARHAEVDYAGELTRAVAWLERSRSPADLARVAERLADILAGPERRELRRAFVDWLWVLCMRLRNADESPPATPPPELTLEDVRMTLEERVAHWPDHWIRQGIERGKREQLRRQAEVRFGAQIAERLSASLRREDDPRRLDAIAEAVVRCETGEDLLRQARRADL